MDEIAAMAVCCAMRKPKGLPDRTLLVLPARERERLESDPLSSGLYMTDVGFFPAAAGHYRDRPNGCNETIVILCVDGRGYCRSGSRSYSVAPMDRLVIRQGTPHEYGADSEDPWTIFWVHVAGSLAPSMLGEGERVSVDRIAPSVAEKAQRAFAELIAIARDGLPSVSPRLASGALWWLLALLGEPAESAAEHAGARPEELAIELMRDRLDLPPSLDELCDAAGLSPSQLSARFRRRTGYPPLAYYTRMRMLEACSLLAGSSAKVSDVADRLGFQDPLHFSRVFKKVIGVSPSAYRDEPKG
jgi:AraC-type DNA-binding domain-containing proteins